jgi:hypothetical protein
LGERLAIRSREFDWLTVATLSPPPREPVMRCAVSPGPRDEE